MYQHCKWTAGVFLQPTCLCLGTGKKKWSCAVNLTNNWWDFNPECLRTVGHIPVVKRITHQLIALFFILLSCCVLKHNDAMAAGIFNNYVKSTINWSPVACQA